MTSYRAFWEVADTSRKNLERFGRRYRDGVVRQAALAAVDVAKLGPDAAIDAMEEIFKRFEIPQSNWDGSIG